MFDMIGICKLSSRSKHFWVNVKEKQKSCFYLKVSQPGVVSISLNQTDIRKRIRKEGSSEQSLVYGSFRAILGRFTQENEFEFVEGIYDSEKVVTVQTPLDEGSYVLLVEYLSFENSGEFRVSTYSDTENVLISEIYDSENEFFNKMELELWRSKVLTEYSTPNSDTFMKQSEKAIEYFPKK